MLKSKRLQIVNRWLVTKAANFENCRIVFPGQAFPERLKKQFRWRLERSQAGHYHLSLILRGQEFYNWLTLRQRSEIGFIK